MNNTNNAFMNITQALDELVTGPPVQSLPSARQFSLDVSSNIIPSAPPHIEGNTTPDVFNPMSLTVLPALIPGSGVLNTTGLTVDIEREVIASEEVSMPPPLATISAAGEIESDTDSESSDIAQIDGPGLIAMTNLFNRINTEDTTAVPHNITRDCTICYNKFGIDKIVNTRCGHVYCNDCFFRWLKGNVTCAMCRKNFTSWRRHSKDQINDDLSAVTDMFNSSLREHVHLTRTNSTLLTNNSKLTCEKDTLMKSLIRTRDLIDFNRGYAQGLLSTFRPKYIGCQEYDRGLMKGYEEFKDIIKKDRKKKRKEANRGFIKQPDGKLRKRESNLFVFHGND